MDKSAIIELYAAADGAEAYVLKGQLEAVGISAEVVGDNLTAALGGLPLGYATAPRIWVRQADEPRAREIVRQWENQQRSATNSPIANWRFFGEFRGTVWRIPDRRWLRLGGWKH